MAFWIVWLVIGIFFILLFCATVIPKIMLRTYAATLPVRVKAVGRYEDKYGDVVVFSPPSQVRKYIKSYLVGSCEKGMYFRGEWAKTAAYVEYELTVYGADNSVLEILRVKEKFNGGQYTRDTFLPAGTDYVTLRIVCVDDDPIPAERRAFNPKYALWLTALSLCIAVSADLILWLGGTFALRCLDRFTMELSLPASSWAAILGFTALAAVAVTWLISLGGFFMRKKRKGDEEE